MFETACFITILSTCFLSDVGSCDMQLEKKGKRAESRTEFYKSTISFNRTESQYRASNFGATKKFQEGD